MKKRIVLIVCGLFLTLAGCGAKSEGSVGLEKEPIPVSEAVENAADQSAEPEAASETEAGATTSRKDGERFEGVIMLEGMEETVNYEHAINESLGIEIDYEYEAFARNSESGKESFISIYEDAGNPDNYLEITYLSENSDSVIASVSEELSKEYDITTDSYELDNAGSCTRIDAFNGVGGEFVQHLQEVYIIPAGDGTVVGTAHFTIESAEGFGHSMDYMMNTLVVIR